MDKKQLLSQYISMLDYNNEFHGQMWKSNVKWLILNYKKYDANFVSDCIDIHKRVFV